MVPFLSPLWLWHHGLITCTYCMGSKVSSLSRIYLYLHLLWVSLLLCHRYLRVSVITIDINKVKKNKDNLRCKTFAKMSMLWRQMWWCNWKKEKMRSSLPSCVTGFCVRLCGRWLFKALPNVLRRKFRLNGIFVVCFLLKRS
jgi:hypothetical protein